jgi:hypothetical protein
MLVALVELIFDEGLDLGAQGAIERKHSFAVDVRLYHRQDVGVGLLSFILSEVKAQHGQLANVR